MGKLEKYTTYKDSGFQWLGQIPDHWKLEKISGLFFERREKVSDKDFEPLSVTKNGILPQLETAVKTDAGDNRKLVKKGDFVVNSRSDRKGSSGLSELDGSVSLINLVLKPLGIKGKYCHYLLRSHSFVEEFYRHGHGIVADLWTTRFWDMKSIMLCIPQDDEQIKIASFLDEKTTKIDEVISQKEKLIELLKERKQIVINEAVTKGLDKTAEFKESGVEWIGKIPKHWDLLANKHIFKLKKDTVGKRSSEYSLLSLTLQGIINRDLDGGGKFPAEFDTYQEVKEDDFVFCLFDVEETPRTVGLSKFDGMITGAYTVMSVKNMDRKYLYYFYLNLDSRKKLKPLYKGLRNTIPKDSFFSFKTFVPPKDEQLQIVEYIEIQIKKIDNAIELQQNYITKLKEYKATLIDSVVTGKVRVAS